MAQWQLTNEVVAAPPGAAAALRKLERSSWIGTTWIGAAWYAVAGASVLAGEFPFGHALVAFTLGLIVHAVPHVCSAMQVRPISYNLATGCRRIIQVGSTDDPGPDSFAMSPRPSDPFDAAPVPRLRLSFHQPPLMAGTVFVGPTRPWRAVAILHPDGRVLAIGHVRRGPDLRSLRLRWRAIARAAARGASDHG